ncbi:MAG TPA: DUF2089 domain-containing protein [Bacteroidales bacterium]|nr:DUF2089 domain-containing protein [Bacteroidales bacterium]
MRKFIKMPHGKSQELEKLFGCSAPIVREALNYKVKKEPEAIKLARKIRKAALEMGGIEFEKK